MSTMTPPMSGPETVATREDGTDVAGVAAPLARGDHASRSRPGPARSGRRRRGPGHAGADQHLHAGREAGDQRADREDDQRRLDQHLLAEEVGQLAPDRAWSRSSRAGWRRRPRCSRSGCPSRSVTMAGSALDTTVLESIATNIASRRPDSASRTSRWRHLAGRLGRRCPGGRRGRWWLTRMSRFAAADVVAWLTVSTVATRQLIVADERTRSRTVLDNADDPQVWADCSGAAPADVRPDHLRVGCLRWIRQQYYERLAVGCC